MSFRLKAYAYILVAVAIWGFAGPVIKFTQQYFDTISFLTLRFALTSAIMLPIWFFAERHKRYVFPRLTLGQWGLVILTGLCATTIQLMLLFYGFEHTSSIEGTLITSVSPIFVVLAGAWFLKDKVTVRERFGAVIALVGTIIVVGLPGKFTNIYGNVLMLLANIVWTAEAVLSKKLLRLDLSPLFLTTFFFFIGFISMTPIYFLNHKSLILYQIPTPGWLGLGYMTLLSGIVAYYLFYKGQKTIEASEANLFLYLQPLFATPLGYLWLQEPISFSFIVGAIIIACGVIISEYKA